MLGKNNINMTSGNLFKKIFIVALPMILSGILQLLYTTCDLIVCGQFGSNFAVGAISATNPIIHLLVNVFLGLSVGANVIMARSYGNKDREKAFRISHTTILIALIVGIFLCIFGLIFAKSFLIAMKTPDDVIHLSYQYLFIYFIGIPFLMIYNFGSSLLRAIGDTKRPFYILAFSGIFNVLCNLLLVIVFKLDVAGVAISTVLSQIISALLIMRCLLNHQDYCKINIKDLAIYKTELKEILLIGIPSGIQALIFSLSNVLIQSSINSLGSVILDGNGAASSLEGFIYTAMNCTAQTGLVFISANYGAKKPENIKKSIVYSSILIVLFSFVIGGTILLFNNQLLGLYLDNPESIKMGLSRLSIIVTTYFLCGLMDLYGFSLRGIGHFILPSVITLIGVCGFRIVWIYCVFPLEKFHSLAGLAYSYPVSWIATCLIHLSLFLILSPKVFKKLRLSN